MGIVIDNINSEIQNKSEELIIVFTNGINSIHMEDTTVSSSQVPQYGKNSAPYRPWYLGGGALGLLGLSRCVSASEDNSTFLTVAMLAAATGCAVYGYKLQKEHEKKFSAPEQTKSNTDYDAIRATCKKESERMVDLVNKKWNDFMKEEKQKLQQSIQSSMLSDEEKQNAMAHTYTYESLDLTNKYVIDGINGLQEGPNFVMNAKNIMSDFQQQVVKEIRTVANKQQSEYSCVNL